MPISLACACGRAMRIKDELAGRRIRCPQCKEILSVPEAAPEKNEEDEVLDVLLTPVSATENARSAPASREPPEAERIEERKPYRPPPKAKRDPRPPEMKRARERRTPRVTFEEGWFGSMNAGVIGGILMMIIAAVWFFVGLAGGYIFF